jgi:hypothetical protein
MGKIPVVSTTIKIVVKKGSKVVTTYSPGDILTVSLSDSSGQRCFHTTGAKFVAGVGTITKPCSSAPSCT